MLVGIALFEVFHDVQYLTIVWIFNVNRVDRNPGVGSFARFLFRRSWSLAGLAYRRARRRARRVELLAGHGCQPINQPHPDRPADGVGAAALLLRRLHLEGPRARGGRVARPSGGHAALRQAQGEAVDRAATNAVLGARTEMAALVIPVAWLARRRRAVPSRGSSAIAWSPRQCRKAPRRATISAGRCCSRGASTRRFHVLEALRLEPAHAEAHSNLGVALARRQTAEAIEHYREALRLDPRQTQVLNLGNALLAQGHVGEAIAQFEAALALDAADPQARTNLAGALVRDGRVDDAIAQLERVVTANPSFQPKPGGISPTRTLRYMDAEAQRNPNSPIASSATRVDQKSSCAPILNRRPSRMPSGRLYVPAVGYECGSTPPNAARCSTGLALSAL